jgi:hypothetical protein
MNNNDKSKMIEKPLYPIIFKMSWSHIRQWEKSVRPTRLVDAAGAIAEMQWLSENPEHAEKHKLLFLVTEPMTPPGAT